MIEHVPKDLQQAFAEEIRRVGERYFVQTPNRYFPIEPHYQMPFVQFLPEKTLKALNRRFTMGFRAKGEWYDTTLLTESDLRGLFPDAEIHKERMFGLTKSLMAVRPARPAGDHSTDSATGDSPSFLTPSRPSAPPTAGP